jgi:hypothetical protein
MDIENLIKDPDKIKELITVLQNMLPQESNKSPIKTKKTKATPNTTKNKFEELGLHKLHKEDTKIDKILNKNPPSPRNRKAKIVSVRCRVCGKSEKISSSLLHDSPERYKCNKCCAGAG